MHERKKKEEMVDKKPCPICSQKLKTYETYCTKCGYSLERKRKKSKKIRWGDIIFVIIILLIFYISIRHFNGQTIIPESIAEAFSFQIRTP